MKPAFKILRQSNCFFIVEANEISKYIIHTVLLLVFCSVVGLAYDSLL